jgi:hypothetical protein
VPDGGTCRRPADFECLLQVHEHILELHGSLPSLNEQLSAELMRERECRGRKEALEQSLGLIAEEIGADDALELLQAKMDQVVAQQERVDTQLSALSERRERLQELIHSQTRELDLKQADLQRIFVHEATVPPAQVQRRHVVRVLPLIKNALLFQATQPETSKFLKCKVDNLLGMLFPEELDLVQYIGFQRHLPDAPDFELKVRMPVLVF